MPPPAVKRTRLVASLALAMIVALVGLGAQTLFRDSFGNLSYDSLHSLAERNFDDSRVVIVYLDIASFLAEHRDPAERWPRDLHARLLNQLTSAGAKAVIFDIIFDSPGGSSSADAEFTEALRRNGRCILAGDHSSKNSHQISSGAEWARLTKLQPPAEEFADAAADWGIAQLWVDDDFVVRRHIGRFQTDHATSLSAAAARMLGIPPAQPPSGVLWMRYYGPALTIPHVSYSEALNPRELPENFFRDKIVFIGARPIEGLMDERRDEFRSPFHS
ncbi:MAG TPA: CHASE2 domain-containing protein, partial [Candidatus Paceibacterota bacterium]|nr:CHASE2 domain-containing protein [Candidatus Paceibacterota bacterium]